MLKTPDAHPDAVVEPRVETRHAPVPSPRPKRIARARQLWLQGHRWLGLLAGPLLVLIGLTGSLLVFDHAIDEWLNPQLLLTTGTGEHRPLVDVIAAAEQEYDGGRSKALSVSSPRVANGVWTVWFQDERNGEARFTAVYVDPYSGEPTGKRVWGEDLLSLIYRLHFRLLSGSVGGALVGAMGIILLVSIVSGVVLWWPLWRHSWRAAFVIRGGKRLAFDLHKTVGIISTAVLIVVAFTGVYMEFPEWVKPVVTAFSSETPHPEGLVSKAVDDRQPLTPEAAIAIAKERYPEARFCHFHPPGARDGVYEVAVRQPGEVQQSFGRTQMFIDQYTGAVIVERRPDDFTVADAFIAWQFPLHNGEAFGLAGRWVVFVTGFVPLGLYVSGLLVWIRKTFPSRRKRRLV